MGLTNYVSTYQHDFSGRDKGFRSRSRSMSAANLVNATQISPPAILRNGNYKTNNGYNRGLSESKGVTIDGREVSSRPVYQRSSKSYTESYHPVTVDGRLVGRSPSVNNISRLRHTSYNSRNKNMYHSHNAPRSYNSIGSTAPPIVNNYLDSHGLNPGLGNSGSTNFPSIYDSKPTASARMANYTRYSPGDWASSNMSHYNAADNSRNNSERIRHEAIRLIRDRDEKTVLTQRDADRRIGERIHDISFWRSEIQAEVERNMNEAHQLMDARKNLERALAETEGPLRITSENIYNREGRKGIDLVNDNVENALMGEVDTIKSSQTRLKKQLESVNHQLGIVRNTRHQLERDLANKDNALSIDHTCHQMKNTSRMINLHGGIDKIDPNVSIPETWSDNSNRNIQESQTARSHSQRMRSDVDNNLTNCANDMWSAWNNSNTNFQQRISETHDAHHKLQNHLSKTMQEIYDQEKYIEHLKKAIRDKAAPLKVSQSRLEARTHRPDIELCRDPPHHRLIEEVSQIQESVDLLNRKLNEAENSHQDLLINKNRLEHDLKVKSNSLFIDREKCLSSRKSFPVVSLATKL
ncbi:tektin-3 isoform X1 [Lepeophtheirus salmonis]|uniref:tektin-3 isoform X1 n=1 Tax=Lepeophtheirus salmonis TaxID=72036 RepID=UPI001AE24F9F|nr:tektin-3-like isoform X1 [Lepeophtheirus salmonis]XP_040564871.1 tektin-3-like isoform X1 [Lepeophtheirus salmonis]XP_040564872.1 tektin-3-like isoform X1 [Lepeophtheirus salmonis]XP_040564874.1 tektin-3-like isoform X1 [Lepeophtheirus salmonis]